MRKRNLQSIAQKSKIFLRKNSPTILTCFGALGVVATAVMAVKATPKALIRIRSDSMANHDGNPEGYTKMEAIESAWLCYIPAVVVGTSSIACIFGANVLNKRQQAELASAYALINSSYQAYRAKLKELYGEEAHNKIMDSIAKDKCEDVYISASGFCECSSLSFDERNPEDNRLFYDSFSKRYFESTIPQVLEAEYHLNRNYILGYAPCLNDFYALLGLESVDGGDVIGWYWSDGFGWIDFNHRKTILDDGLEVHIIDMVWCPSLEDEE